MAPVYELSAEEQGIPGTELLVDIQETGNDIVLIPSPTASSRDPLTWSKLQKYWQMFLVAFYACAFSLGENQLGAAMMTLSSDTHVTIANLNGGGALNYLLLGFVNIFWIPAAVKIGRRFVFLVSTLCVLGSMVWTGFFTGTAQWYLSCLLNGFGTSAYESVIQLSIFDMFYVHERGRMLSIYLFGQQLGSVVGLISGGAIADTIGWRWSQYYVAIVIAVVFLLFLFTFEETSFPRFIFWSPKTPEKSAHSQVSSDDAEVTEASEISEVSSNDGKNLKQIHSQVAPHCDEIYEYQSSVVEEFVNLPPRTFRERLALWTYYPQDTTSYWTYFCRPIFLFKFPNIIVAGLLFACGCTAGVVSNNVLSEIVSSEPYNFSDTSAGLICFGEFVGNIIGWVTCYLSDYVVIYFAKRNGGVKEPEMRLYWVPIPFIYAAAGYMMYGWGAQEGAPWPVLAVALALMIAHQVAICGIGTAYGMDCFQGITGELVVVLAVCSSAINFAFSYSVQPFILAAGYGWAFFFYGMVVLSSMLLCIPTIKYGKSWRRKCAPRYYQFLAERDNSASTSSQ